MNRESPQEGQEDQEALQEGRKRSGVSLGEGGQIFREALPEGQDVSGSLFGGLGGVGIG